jgi:hypothetical protein
MRPSAIASSASSGLFGRMTGVFMSKSVDQGAFSLALRSIALPVLAMSSPAPAVV